MSETFTRDDVDFGYNKVPNGLWTADLSHGAKCLLGWLWSHDHDYLAKLSVRRIGSEFGGGGQVVEWLRDLAAKGYVTKSKHGTQYEVHLVGSAWKALTVRKPSDRSETEHHRDGYRTVTATETEHREDKREDQREDQSSSPPTPRKRGEVDEAFEAWWKLYPKKKNGKGQAHKHWRKMTWAERQAAGDGIERHVAWWIQQGTDEQFVPGGDAWLYQRRWEDEQPRAAPAPVARTNGERTRAMIQRERERDGRPALDLGASVANFFDRTSKVIELPGEAVR